MARFCVVISLAVCRLVTGSNGTDPVQASVRRCGAYKYGFECQDNGKCLPYHFTCDGYGDCTDGSDEDLEWCPPREECSGPHKFQCDNGKCEIIDFRCDDYEDCGDGSDKRNCLEYECPPADWQCPDGICIDMNYLCDGDADCDDGSDELPANCPHIQPLP